MIVAPAPALDDRSGWKAYLERFAPVGSGECWQWTRSCDTNGYGIISIQRRTQTVHRIAYQLWNGDVGDQCVLHRCDNRKCCNPAHLFLGTRADNNKDRDAKGRHVPLKGSRHGNAKLNESQVLLIRTMKGTATQREVASMFSVDRTLIGLIWANKAWQHVQPAN